ncbi:uncharacterized protein [Littorina saxatilis]|uniref:uncharacterized protein isoform X1 n=1 Tax=Littorina saxatilis TaxID=31220 RepID=UPI0038B542FD
MATRTRVSLFVLVLWCHTTAGYFHQLTGENATIGTGIMVPSAGVYLVTMVADPNRISSRIGMTLNLRIEDESTNFTAYGRSGIMGGLTVAIPLNKSDVIHAHATGSFLSDNEALLGVVLVSHDKAHVSFPLC